MNSGISTLKQLSTNSQYANEIMTVDMDALRANIDALKIDFKIESFISFESDKFTTQMPESETEESDKTSEFKTPSYTLNLPSAVGQVVQTAGMALVDNSTRTQAGTQNMKSARAARRLK